MIDFKKKIEELEQSERQEAGDISEEVLIQGKRTKRITRIIIAVLILGIIFSGNVLISSQTGHDWFGTNILNRVKKLTESEDNKLKGEEQDRINILLLGMGGENHEGGYLTDTIMLASIQPSTKKVSLISIPRDLVVPIEGYGWRKINSINALAESDESGSGGPATMETLSSVFDIPIHYYVRIDFQGFIDIIDELGGLEVNVENAFDDYSYPIKGREDAADYYSRFEHLHFDAGLQNMDGETALKYARSRHAYGSEGTDFARARRQQIIIQAAKDKLLSRGNILKPGMVTRVISELSDSIDTDISVWEIIRLWDKYRDVDKANISSFVFSNSPEGFLVDSRGEDGAYILVPSSGNFQKINNHIKGIFGDTSTSSSLSDKTAELPKIDINAKVIVLNGTWITGLAGTTAGTLQADGFDIVQVGNAGVRDYSDSIIYDLSFGAKNEQLEYMKDSLDAKQASEIPTWLSDVINAQASSSPDFVLILGTSAQ